MVTIRSLLAISISLLASLFLLETTSAHSTFQEKDNFWFAWHFTPGIALPLILIVFTYLRGWQKRLRQKKPIPVGRTIAFFAGMGCFLVALQSPIEPLSDHFLFIHQLEHMLLRVFGPLFTIFAMPLTPLLQGLPFWLRHWVLAPLIRHSWTKAVYGCLSHPVVASVLFVWAMVFWQIPPIHDASVQNEWLHDLMHLSLILTGFFFWWLIADPRGPRARLPYALRLVVLWAVTVPDAVMGAFVTLARYPLYQVYDVMGGRWGIDRLLDQQLGGIVMWNDAMMGVIGMAVVFLLWIREGNPRKSTTRCAPT
ncbi:MAG: cytochrome c oxidase assembly protein [Methylohalobius sp.]